MINYWQLKIFQSVNSFSSWSRLGVLVLFGIFILIGAQTSLAKIFYLVVIFILGLGLNLNYRLLGCLVLVLTGLTWNYPPQLHLNPKCLNQIILLRPAQYIGVNQWQAVASAENVKHTFMWRGYGQSPALSYEFSACGQWKTFDWLPWWPTAPSGIFISENFQAKKQFLSLRSIWWIVSEKLAHTLSRGVKANIPPPADGFLLGLLWSGRSGLSQEWQALFLRAGLSHVMAVSGFNVTIIFTAWDRVSKNLFAKLNITSVIWQWSISILLVTIFALMAGASSAVMRAALSTSIMTYITLKYRRPKIIRVLLFVAVLMVIFNPYLIRYDLGWQLTFTAVLGLILFEAKIRSWLDSCMAGKFNWLNWRESLSATLAASIGTVPLIAWSFKNISLVAPISNVLLLWSLPGLMLLGFAVSIIGQFSSWPIWGLIAWLPARVFLLLVTWLGSLPGGYWSWT